MPTTQKTIQRLFQANQLEPFIRHIRFPLYKNLAPNTRIDFTHPITVLVGTNGTNKSSVLRALYGAPGQNNVGNFWFSSHIDPIEEGEGAPNCFIYGYVNQDAKRTVEVLKTRIKKEGDPDYWEPSRPIAKYGMELVRARGKNPPPGALKTRWKTIEKEVVYIDFRAALSAFDKFFYYGELRNKTNSNKNKKDLIRSRSPHLKNAVDKGSKSFIWHVERIVSGENRSLTAAEIKHISAILGRNYAEIKLVRHTFYNGDGYTAQLKSNELRYTEAFAGSGEFSVVRLVTTVLNAAPRSLILLDEPEVSLHPGAQERLMTFLAEQVKLHKHQIVISTHSPALVRSLPPEAIKVLIMDPLSGKVVLPQQSALPEEAFFHIGEPAIGRKTVVVEDKLAKELAQKALRLAGEAIYKLFEVTYFPGGAETLWCHYLPIFAAENRDDVIVLLDGDKAPDEDFPNPDEIPVGHDDEISEAIKRVTGADVQFPVDGGNGGGNDMQRRQARRQYVKWARTYVGYLPCQTPEEFVWCRAPEIKKNGLGEQADYKNAFVELAKKELGFADFEQVSAEDILYTQKRLLATVGDDDPDLINLMESLKGFLEQ